MVPLTSESWAGLPLYVCPASEGVHRVDIELDDDLLVLWRSCGTAVELRKSAAHRWAYVSRTGRLDLILAGRFESMRRGRLSADAWVVSFPKERVSVLWEDGAHGPAMPAQSQFQFENRSLARLVSALHAHHHADEPFGACYTRALSTVALDRLATIASPPTRARRHLRPTASRIVAQLIETQLDNLPDLMDLAALAGMSTNQFLKWFKLTFGMTPHQYIVRQRVERARHLLALPHPVSLTALALQLGFNSHAHFTSVFRAQTGLTPSAYRRQRLDAHASTPSGSKRSATRRRRAAKE